MENRLIFIVGTGTEVGKTYCTLKLAKKYMENKKISVLKPIETGFLKESKNITESDSYKYVDLLGKKFSEINSYLFSKPMSPHIASEIDGIDIDLNKVRDKILSEKINNDITIVEGAGGLMVPLKDNFLYLDLLKEFRGISTVILVTKNCLGAINHTLLTATTLKSNGIDIEGIIFNDMNSSKDKFIKKNNIETIISYTNLKEIKLGV